MTESPERYLPLYESKMLHHFDDRWATYGSDGSTRDVSQREKEDADFAVLPRYWIDEAEVDEAIGTSQALVSGWRKICRATDERTLISFGFPRAGLGDSANVAVTDRTNGWVLTAAFASFAVDYIARQKVGGTNFNFFHMAQLPVLGPDYFITPWTDDATWFRSRCVELIYTSQSMARAAGALGDSGQPFHWDDERRSRIRAELDAAFFHLYGVPRDDVDYIMDTFSIVRRKDEATYGEYRSKRLILEVFDAMQQAIDMQTEYTTILDPPPGHGPRHEPGVPS